MKLSEIVIEVLKEGSPVMTTGERVQTAGELAQAKTKVAGEEVQKMASDIAKDRAEKLSQQTVKPPTPPLEPIVAPDLTGGQGSKEQAEKQKEAQGIISQEDKSKNQEEAVKFAADNFNAILQNTDPGKKNPKIMQQMFDELVNAITTKESKNKDDIDMLDSLEKMSRIGMEKLAVLSAGNTQDIMDNLQKLMSLGKIG